MRQITLLTAVALALLAADSLEAQRRMRGRNRDQWQRPEEITNRVAVYFKEIPGPETEDRKVADLGTVQLVREAAAAGEVSVLYLHDGALEARPVRAFESALFRADARGDELGIKLRLFHCGQIDISEDPALKDKYGKKAPLFVAFDKSGKELRPVSMSGMKPDPSALESLLDRASKAAFKPTLPSFAKKYGKLVEDLEEVLKERAAAEQAQAEAGGNRAKLNKANKQLDAASKDEQELLDREEKMLAEMRFPERGDKRLGGRRPNRRNNRAGNTGKGNTGKGNTGG